jgi:hypothetical protein
MDEALTDLDAAGLLAASARAVRARRLAEVDDLEVLSQWAAVHSAEPVRLGDKLVQLGGEGTPSVQDFSLGEIALARGTAVTATSNALADVLDLQHRLPRTWAVVRSGDAEVFIARRVAKLSRHLPARCVGVVDAAVAAVIAHEFGGRVLAVAEAKIIEADPSLHDQRVEQERCRRYVGVSRVDEFGLRTLIARLEAGEAELVESTVARVAELLEERYPDAGADELRAIALGYLARPVELMELLGEPVPSKVPDLRPRAVLYVHLHEAALHGADAVARVEGLCPMSLAQLQRLLGRRRLTIRPVIDLNDRVRCTSYEHPESLKERVHLTTGGDYWPYAVSTSRRVDYDHPIPYQSDSGPPTQTGTHNSGPLGRRHHRWKTHAGYRSRQSGEGRYAWLTPHGLGFLVDQRGTRPIPREHAEMIIDAPPGVDLYPSDVRIEFASR